jgi:hypothetical protein
MTRKWVSANARTAAIFFTLVDLSEEVKMFGSQKAKKWIL